MSPSGLPDRTRPFVQLEEQTKPEFVREGAPSEGALLSYGTTGVINADGVYVEIQASSEALLIGAARNLTKIQPGP